MPENKPPFVETSIARLMLSRMRVTHDERGISVFSGPWGIGKTTAINAFQDEQEHIGCQVIKVEPANSRKGVGPLPILHQILEALRARYAPETYIAVSSAQWDLRRKIYNIMERAGLIDTVGDWQPPFTFIFDEAQYLSRMAIEMLRYWNDSDRTSVPFPVGLIFVGNNEFALEEGLKGGSVLSGAVRSRLLFEVPLAYQDLNDTDLMLFAQSRGVVDAAALQTFVAHFKQPRVKRDLRQAERLLSMCRRMAGDDPISREIVASILNP